MRTGAEAAAAVAKNCIHANSGLARRCPPLCSFVFLTVSTFLVRGKAEGDGQGDGDGEKEKEKKLMLYVCSISRPPSVCATHTALVVQHQYTMLSSKASTISVISIQPRRRRNLFSAPPYPPSRTCNPSYSRRCSFQYLLPLFLFSSSSVSSFFFCSCYL